MHLGTLAVVGLVNLLTALTFAGVAVRLQGRAVAGDERLALKALVTWWSCMGVFLAIQAVLVLATIVDAPSIPGFTAARYLDGPLLALGSWGLTFHILFLYTGRARLAAPLALYFLLVAIAYDATAYLHPIVALVPTAWEVTPVFDVPLTGDPLWTAVLAGVGIPLMGACVAYASLLRRLARRDQRRRVLLVSTGIFAWVAAGLAAQLAGGPLARFATITLLGLLASLLVFLAYFPPEWLRRGDPPEWHGEAAPPMQGGQA